ncbi:FG-GAP repeat protein [Caulifigura coniformis]|uniref:FG-GAP repeat protein n=1 Tax=Caulifigura coniformis TaxID=2527983 RepID=A0A517SMX5_9PLAN|nr:VCBS repeat-containing protein [Caulifigura coniformis]QDT57471.1 FG-GAP repeat protein [Caulifigura coniformis]
MSFRCFVLLLFVAPAANATAQWQRHVIDDSSRGADGTRLKDVNGDGLPDIVTGWEQGGVVRLMVHPGAERVRKPWPAVTVGTARDVEDAVLVDLDGDGACEVVSCCEGDSQQVRVSWAPADRSRLLDAEAWSTAPLPASLNVTRWMFALPAQIDGRHGIDFFAGGKSRGSQIGWFQAPADPRALAEWTFHPLRPVGWTMSLVSSDMDGDGDLDLVFSDRKGDRSGVYWLENPGRDVASPWIEHAIAGVGAETMFLDLADLDSDGLEDIVVATKPAHVLWLKRLDRSGEHWKSSTIPFPPMSGTAKAVSLGDLDLDGRMDLVVTCEAAASPLHGVSWLSCDGPPGQGSWSPRPISGSDGVKYDLAPLVDLDGDGDLDVLTCEENRGLGVIWYENPARSPGAGKVSK